MLVRRPLLCSLLAVAALALFVPAVAPAADAPQHSAVTPAPRGDDWWQKRHAGMNERVQQGKADLVFIGDSITQGWEGGGRKVWEEFYAKRNAVNLGISGDRTQHVLWRLENGNLAGISPKLAVVMIGTNNSGDNTSAEIADGVKAIVAKLRKDLPDTHVLVLGIFPRGATPDDQRRRTNAAANELLQSLDDGKMVHYLDFGAKFLTDSGELTREIMPDLLHLNEKSYRIWAEAIEPAVEKHVGPRG